MIRILFILLLSTLTNSFVTQGQSTKGTLKFNTQTLETWDESKNDWYRNYPQIACNSVFTFTNITIQLHFEVVNTKKITNVSYKWSKRLDKTKDGRSWINYTLVFDKYSEFFFINLDKDNDGNIRDAVLINDKAMLVFFNK